MHDAKWVERNARRKTGSLSILLRLHPSGVHQKGARWSAVGRETESVGARRSAPSGRGGACGGGGDGSQGGTDEVLLFISGKEEEGREPMPALTRSSSSSTVAERVWAAAAVGARARAPARSPTTGAGDRAPACRGSPVPLARLLGACAGAAVAARARASGRRRRLVPSALLSLVVKLVDELPFWGLPSCPCPMTTPAGSRHARRHRRGC
jgi:hypothetical protein